MSKKRTLKETIELFWSKVDKKSIEDCWEWQGYKDNHGYGLLWAPSEQKWSNRYAHRLAFYYSKGIYNIPKGNSKSVIRHTCDNPGCCNPNHLKEGTQVDNLKDMFKRGRHNPGILRGEDSPHAKLTWKIVKHLRNEFSKGVQKDWAKKKAKQYNVHEDSIENVVYHNTWKEVK